MDLLFTWNFWCFIKHHIDSVLYFYFDNRWFSSNPFLTAWQVLLAEQCWRWYARRCFPRPSSTAAAGPGIPKSWCRWMRQTLQGSFSAVSKRKFGSKYAFESSRRDLHNALLCTAPKSHFFTTKFSKTPKLSSPPHPKKERTACFGGEYSFSCTLYLKKEKRKRKEKEEKKI